MVRTCLLPYLSFRPTPPTRRLPLIVCFMPLNPVVTLSSLTQPEDTKFLSPVSYQWYNSLRPLTFRGCSSSRDLIGQKDCGVSSEENVKYLSKSVHGVSTVVPVEKTGS